MKCLRAAIQEINTWHVLKSCQSESFKYSKVLKITETKWQHVNCNFHLKLQYIKFNNFKNEIKNSQNLDVFVTFLYNFDLAKCGWLDFA